MRNLTKKEFKEMIILEDDNLKGVTEFEIEMYYYFFKMGRASVRW